MEETIAIYTHAALGAGSLLYLTYAAWDYTVDQAVCKVRNRYDRQLDFMRRMDARARNLKLIESNQEVVFFKSGGALRASVLENDCTPIIHMYDRMVKNQKEELLKMASKCIETVSYTTDLGDLIVESRIGVVNKEGGFE